MNKETPSSSVQALISARYVTQPSSVTPDRYDTLKRKAKQITREISAELTRPDPDFQKAFENSEALNNQLLGLNVMRVELCLQTPNCKIPRPYVRGKVDHADDIERHLVNALECLNWGDSPETLERLMRSVADAYFLVRDAYNESNRLQGI